jgi:ferredoxin
LAHPGAGIEVSVNRNKCCGYGLCAEICPEVFELDDMGFALVTGAAVPQALAGRAREAAETCPEEAITIREAGATAR